MGWRTTDTADASVAIKEILVHWDRGYLMVALVPKTRGVGFLRTPAGHHVSDRITAIEDAVGKSVFGLDGHLEVDGVGPSAADREGAWAAFVDALARNYPFPVRVVEAEEFWTNHPLGIGTERRRTFGS